jgi:3-oxoacyl-[acyl-carrier protein] reductase
MWIVQKNTPCREKGKNAVRMLQEQTAIVFGGSGLLGSRIAQSLAEQGAKVVVHYSTHAEKAHDLVASIKNSGGQAAAIHADGTSQEEIHFLIEESARLFGSIEIAVSCVHGHSKPKPVIDMVWEDWEVHLSGLKGHFFLCKEVLPYMRQQHYGRIIFISGGLSRRYFKGCSAYTTVKAGLNGFCKTLALEEGEHDITVNIVAPGKVVVQADKTWDELGGISSQSIPLQQFATPEDVADAVLYFASPKASGITGQTLFVAGGEIMP